jgi:hypothetical protein
MSRLWSKPLELLGRLRLRFPPSRHRALVVGVPGGADAREGQGWRPYARADRLFDVWGPHPHSPWVPFHCVPLFAALDTVPTDSVGPAAPRTDGPGATPPPTGSPLDGPDPVPATPVGPRTTDASEATVATAAAAPMTLPEHARPGAPAPRWVTGETWTVVDLPGPLAVEAAVWLIDAAGCQPVCTFDNWPHPKGLLRPEHTLAELLRWASTVAQLRTSLTRTAPPLWICDSERLGTRAGSPGEFDNRYFLDDSILPGPEMLRRNAVKRVVYLTGGVEIPVLDLEEPFAELLAAGFEVLLVDVADPGLEPRPFSARRVRPRPRRSGFRESAAGGFGTEVPEPSSGGGG